MALVCDICGNNVPVMTGYALTTEQVVTRTNYWAYLLKNPWASVAIKANSLDAKERYSFLTAMVRNQAESSTPWLVCDNCISLFVDLDQAKARSVAKEYWSTTNAKATGWTNNTGTGSIDKAFKAFVEAWVRVFGSLPIPMTIITDTPETAEALYSKLTKPQTESKKKGWGFWK